MQKKEWSKPNVEILEVKMTEASGNWGDFDEGYNESLGERGQTGLHHAS